MSVTTRYVKYDRLGLPYYVDEDGNTIEPKYNALEQYYIDTGPLEWAQDDKESERRNVLYQIANQRKASPFLLNTLDRPVPEGPRYPLWGNYWALREFCILAGDTGVGKSLLAIQIGKAIAGGLVLGNPDCVGRPRKVLYIDFELDAEGFWQRYGNNDGADNFCWAGFNAHATMPKNVASQTDWLLNNLETHIKETGAQVLIIDQIDRLQLPISKRTEFLYKLRDLARKYKLSTLLTLNTRARNLCKGVELHHIQNSKLYLPFADCAVAVAADFNNPDTRYIKPMKMRNRSLNHANELECFNIYQPEKDWAIIKGSKQLILLTAKQPEEVLLKMTPTQIKHAQMMFAEVLRKEGMTCEEIGQKMHLPISTIKRWVGSIKPDEPKAAIQQPVKKEWVELKNPFKNEQDWPEDEPEPDDGIEFNFDFAAKPDELTEEEWAVCVNNPNSPNYDDHAYNPYFLAAEEKVFGRNTIWDD
jgi:hypothetical protein